MLLTSGAPTRTFDDLIIYKSPLWNLNNLPVVALAYRVPTMQDAGADYPANGNHMPGQVFAFVLTYASAVTVTGRAVIENVLPSYVRL